MLHQEIVCFFHQLGNQSDHARTSLYNFYETFFSKYLAIAFGPTVLYMASCVPCKPATVLALNAPCAWPCKEQALEVAKAIGVLNFWFFVHYFEHTVVLFKDVVVSPSVNPDIERP